MEWREARAVASCKFEKGSESTKRNEEDEYSPLESHFRTWPQSGPKRSDLKTKARPWQPLGNFDPNRAEKHHDWKGNISFARRRLEYSTARSLPPPSLVSFSYFEAPVLLSCSFFHEEVANKKAQRRKAAGK